MLCVNWIFLYKYKSKNVISQWFLMYLVDINCFKVVTNAYSVTLTHPVGKEIKHSFGSIKNIGIYF